MAKAKKTETIYETPGFRSGPVVSGNPKSKVTNGKLEPVSNTVVPKLNNRQPVSVTNPKKSGLTAAKAPNPKRNAPVGQNLGTVSKSKMRTGPVYETPGFKPSKKTYKTSTK